jgi:hypothetical protein
MIQRAYEAGPFTGMQQLSHLVIRGSRPMGGSLLRAGILAGKTLLQHLEITQCSITGGSTGIAEILCHMQDMQQLTYLK